MAKKIVTDQLEQSKANTEDWMELRKQQAMAEAAQFSEANPLPEVEQPTEPLPNELASESVAAVQSPFAADAEEVAGTVELPEVEVAAAAPKKAKGAQPAPTTGTKTASNIFEELLNQREAARLEREREQEAKRLQRERLGTGIADLAAIVGDMIRASEGAQVGERNWRQIYDNLTAQEKANLDNYRIRMQKLKDDARLKQQQDAAAKEREAERNLRIKLQNDTIAARAEEGEKTRQLQRDLAAAKNLNDYNIAVKRTENSGNKSGADIMIQGKRYHFKTAYDMNAFLSGLKGILQDPAKYPQGAEIPRVNLDDNWDEQRRAQEVNDFVLGHFQKEEWKNAPKAVKDAVAQYIVDNAFRLVADNAPSIEISEQKNDGSQGVGSQSTPPQPPLLTAADSAQVASALNSLFSQVKSE